MDYKLSEEWFTEEDKVKGPYKSEEEAALYALKEINKQSVAENREYAGIIVKHTDGNYYYSRPMPGKAGTSSPLWHGIPSRATSEAYYHTHGGFMMNYDSEKFSEKDKSSAIEKKHNLYLATPMGNVKRFNHKTGTIDVLGGRNRNVLDNELEFPSLKDFYNQE